MDVDDIGNSDATALLCHTNDTNCCGHGDPGPNVGVWLFPNGTAPPTVSALSSGTGFSRDRGTMVVRLRRQNNPPERGRFSCDLLGSTVYANICE